LCRPAAGKAKGIVPALPGPCEPCRQQALLADAALEAADCLVYLPGPYLIGADVAMAVRTPIKIMSRRSVSDYQRNWPLVARLERRLHTRMDAVIGNSRAVVRQLIEEGIPEAKVRLIYNGIAVSAKSVS